MDEMIPQSPEIRRLCRLLRRTAEMAREAGMTGSLERGAPRAAMQFNRVVRRLEDLGAVPADFFPPLNEEASLDEIGVASLQLAGYLDESDERETASAPAGPLFGSLNISHLGDLKELEQLRAMGRSTKKRCPDLLQDLPTYDPDAPSKEATRDP
jgi:hypothetical protein